MPLLKKPQTARALAVLCANVAENKIASEIIIMNLKKADTPPTDYFVICSCDSEPQVRAIVDEVYRECTRLGIQKPRVEGLDAAQWVLVDFFDVVFHIMLKSTRDYYNIEKLWSDAQFLQLTENGTARKFVPEF